MRGSDKVREERGRRNLEKPVDRRVKVNKVNAPCRKRERETSWGEQGRGYGTGEREREFFLE
jgi:hypothetical protein